MRAHWGVAAFGSKDESVPAARYDHAVCVSADSKCMFLHGGRTDAPKVFNDAFSLSFGDSCVWTRLSSAERVFPSRYAHQMGVFGNSLFIIGGRDENHTATNDVFALDLQSMNLTKIDAKGQAPAPRYEHSMVVVDKGLLVIGGRDGSDVGLTDMCLLEQDGSGSWCWRILRPSGIPLVPRWQFNAWAKKSIVYIFGGFGDDGAKVDMLCYNIDTNELSDIQQKGEVPPATQRYHAVIAGGKVCCFGEKGPLRMFFLDFDKKYIMWDCCKATGALPSLVGFALACVGNNVYLMGGKPFLGKDGELMVWALDVVGLLGDAGSASATSPSRTSSTDKGTMKPEKKYGTLRSMFSRKSSTNSMGNDKLSSSSGTITGGSAGASPVSSPQKTRKTTRTSIKGFMEDQRTVEKQAAAGGGSGLASTGSTGGISSGGLSVSGLIARKKSIDSDEKSGNTVTSPSAVRHERIKSMDEGFLYIDSPSDANFSNNNNNNVATNPGSGASVSFALPAVNTALADRPPSTGSSSSTMVSPRSLSTNSLPSTDDHPKSKSPFSSPRQQQQQNEELTVSLARATQTVERLRMELEQERKKSSSLREEIDKISGKSDASMLVRKALDEEVKQHNALKVRTDAFERDIAALAVEKVQLQEQANRLKKVIAGHGKEMAAVEVELTQRTEALKEAQASLAKMEQAATRANQLARQVEDERIERMVVNLRLRRRTGLLKDTVHDLQALKSEFAELTAAVSKYAPDGVRETVVSQAEILMEAISGRVDRTLKEAFGGIPAASLDALLLGSSNVKPEATTNSSSASVAGGGGGGGSGSGSLLSKSSGAVLVDDGGGSESHDSESGSSPLMPALALQRVRPVMPGSSGSLTPKEVVASPEAARQKTLLSELEYRNTLPLPQAKVMGRYTLVDEHTLRSIRFAKKMQKLREQKSILSFMEEVFAFEKSFLRVLEVLDNHVYGPLSEQGILNDEDCGILFGSLPDMLLSQAELLDELCAVQPPGDVLGFFAVFFSRMKGTLDIYEHYCEHLPVALAQLEFGKARSLKLQQFLSRLKGRASDVRFLLAEPVVHLHCMNEFFLVLSSMEAFDDLAAEDCVQLKSLVASLLDMFASPLEVAKMDAICSIAQLAQMEQKIRAVSGGGGFDLLASGRLLVDEDAFLVLEVVNNERVAHTMNVLLCNDFLLMLKKGPVAPLAGAGASSAVSGSAASELANDVIGTGAAAGVAEVSKFWLYDLVPLSVLQLRKAPDFCVSDESIDSSFSFYSRSRTGVVYVMIAPTVYQAKKWEEMIRRATVAAAEFGQDQSSESSITASSSSGWLADHVPIVVPRQLTDSEDICYTTDTVSGRFTVRGGKPSALVVWLINDLSGPTATSETLQFLQSCPKVVPAKAILDTAMSLFKQSSGNVLQRRRVLQFMALWVQEFCYRDFLSTGDVKGLQNPLFKRLLRFLDSQSGKSELTDGLNMIKLGILRGVDDWNRIQSDEKQSDEIKEAGSGGGVPALNLNLETLDLEDVSASVLGEQLTLHAKALLDHISDDDFYQGDKAANVAAMIKFWNELVEWCTRYLTNYEDESILVSRLKRLLAVARRCLELSNYDSLFAITLGIDCAKVPKTAMEMIGRIAHETFEQMGFVTNVLRGFANYRGITESLGPPAVPYLAIGLKDIVLIRENDSYIEGSELLNYRKLIILGSRLRFFHRFRRVQFPFSPIPAVQGALQSLPKQQISARRSSSPHATPTGAGSMSPVSQPSSAERGFSGKLQQLRRSVLTGGTLFSPRDAPTSTSVPSSARGDRTDRFVESRRPFSARARIRQTPREMEGGGGGGSPVALAAVSSSSPVTEPKTSSRWGRAQVSPTVVAATVATEEDGGTEAEQAVRRANRRSVRSMSLDPSLHGQMHARGGGGVAAGSPSSSPSLVHSSVAPASTIAPVPVSSNSPAASVSPSASPAPVSPATSLMGMARAPPKLAPRALIEDSTESDTTDLLMLKENEEEPKDASDDSLESDEEKAL